MPIQIRCQCGKVLKVPDNAAGKSVKCPSCDKQLKVPAPAASGASGGGSDLEDLFNEEGFSAKVEKVCPACGAELAATAVLCTKCGFNLESGERLAAHRTAGVDVDHGTLALEKAESDMQRDAEIQQKLLGAGMPWWGLALVLFMIGSALTIAVLYVNASRRVDESFEFNPVALFMLLTGVACAMIALGAYWTLLVHACRNIGKTGLLVLIPPYALYYCFVNFRATWKILGTLLVLGGAAGGLIGAAMSQGL